MGDLTTVDIGEIILLILVFTIGVGSFIWAATKEEETK